MKANRKQIRDGEWDRDSIARNFFLCANLKVTDSNIDHCAKMLGIKFPRRKYTPRAPKSQPPAMSNMDKRTQEILLALVHGVWNLYQDSDCSPSIPLERLFTEILTTPTGEPEHTPSPASLFSQKKEGA